MHVDLTLVAICCKGASFIIEHDFNVPSDFAPSQESLNKNYLLKKGYVTE